MRKGWLQCLILILCSGVSFPQQSKASPPESLNQWRASRAAALMEDFAELARYRDADAALKSPAPGESRVVFFGDSITDFWKLADYFPGKPYINRGISGQTTPQMLVRFRQDVVDLKPRAVVILAGTNDIAGNTGPERLEDIEANYASMAEIAKTHNIRVVYSSVMPVHNYTPESHDLFAERSPQKILDLNRWLTDYCATGNCVYLDYFSAMVDERGFMRRELADDGLHPNAVGYKLMAPLAEAAVEKALKH